MTDEYTFSISHGKSIIDTHTESAVFENHHDAYLHFRALLKKFKVDGGTYYLCNWGRTEDMRHD